jgi:CDP-glucose 4,6-dehydratase
MTSSFFNAEFWRGKRVFLTGHSGFKGGWIAHWLSDLGARVHGFSLAPPTKPSFFAATKLVDRISSSVIGDIRDLNSLSVALATVQPDVVIHMAAQPLVRASYKIPVDTFAANVMGTVNVLEAARQSKSVRAIVNITTDKCYENKEWLWPYRENDRLGGHDPYSASKACAELATVAYRKSFLADSGIQVATVRAGNVIGGGDWAEDRLVPDFLKALDAGEAMKIRSPNAIRPWQHVLEPLAGYLMLAEKLVTHGENYAGSWNFGPNEQDAKPVSWIIDHLFRLHPNAKWEVEEGHKMHEAATLKLDSVKAKVCLGWAPRWDLGTALARTIEWHLAWCAGDDMAAVTTEQIQDYISA